MNGPIPNSTKGLPVDSIQQLPQGAKFAVLRHGEHVHVAATAPVEIARSRMMNGVVLAPAVVRRQSQDGESSP